MEKQSEQQDLKATYEHIQKERRVLYKKGKKLRLRIKRFFVIKNDHFLYFKNQKQEKVSGIINLYSCKFQNVQSTLKQYPYSIMIVGFVESYQIWIYCKSFLENQFFQRFLHLASSGAFNQNVLDKVIEVNDKQQLMKQPEFQITQTKDQIISEENECNIEVSEDVPNTTQIGCYEFAYTRDDFIINKNCKKKQMTSRIMNINCDHKIIDKEQQIKTYSPTKLKQSDKKNHNNYCSNYSQQLMTNYKQNYQQINQLQKLNSFLGDIERMTMQEELSSLQSNTAKQNNLNSSEDIIVLEEDHHNTCIGNKYQQNNFFLKSNVYSNKINKGTEHCLQDKNVLANNNMNIRNDHQKGDQHILSNAQKIKYSLVQLQQNEGENQEESMINFDSSDESKQFISNENEDDDDEEDADDIQEKQQLQQKCDNGLLNNINNSCNICAEEFNQEIPKIVDLFNNADGTKLNSIRNNPSNNQNNYQQQYSSSNEQSISIISENNNIPQRINKYQFIDTGQTSAFNIMYQQQIIQHNKPYQSNYKSQQFLQLDSKSERIMMINQPQDILQLCKPDLLKYGIRCLWSFEFEQAMKCFQLYNKDIIPLMQIEIEMQQLIVSGIESKFQKCEDQINNQISFFEGTNIQNRDPKASNILLDNYTQMEKESIISELYLAKGILYSFLNRKVNSILCFKNCYQALARFKRLMAQGSIIQDETKNRLLFIEGVINIGLSLMPQTFTVILKILGIQSDIQKGIHYLTECKNMMNLRSNYACIILTIFHLEVTCTVEKAMEELKDNLLYNNQSPIYLWIYSLIQWKCSKPQRALIYIEKSIYSCRKMNEEVFLLQFEKGWFNLCLLNWEDAKICFKKIISITLNSNLISLQYEDLQKIYSQQSQSNSQLKFYLDAIQKQAKEMKQETKIIFPHKYSIIIILGICCSALNQKEEFQFWISLGLYFSNKSSEQKSKLDQEFLNLSKIYIKRNTSLTIKFEILYFSKEIPKIDYDKLISIQQDLIALKQIYQQNPNNISRDIIIVEMCSISLILISIYYVLEEFSECQQCYQKNIHFYLSLPQEFQYLHHHSLHWLAMGQLQLKNYTQAKQYLQMELKFKNCEFSLSNKVELLLNDL